MKSTQEVKEVISITEGLGDGGEGIYYTITDDGRAYTDDEYITLASECEVDKAVAEFVENYKRGLLNKWKYGVK